MTTYATVEQVAAEIGRPITTQIEIAQVQQWLDRAERIIRRRIPDLDQRVASGIPDAATVADVEVAAVSRKVYNPRGLRSTQRSIDDGSTQDTVDSTQSDGVLRILDDEWDLLLPGGEPEAFSTRLRYTPDRHHHPLSQWSRP